MADRDAPLVYLPGTLCDGREFAPVAQRLGIEPVVLQLSGAQSAPAVASRIVREAPARFRLAGFSLGAIVALEVVARVPERVEGLVLIGGSARVLSGPVAVDRRRSAKLAISEGTRSHIANVWEVSVPASRRNDDALRRLVDDMAGATPLETFREQIEISLNRNESRWRLSEIACPTLVLCGAEDGICPPELSQEMAEGIPGAKLVIIDDAGHYLTLEQPDAVAREMQTWLATQTARSLPRS